MPTIEDVSKFPGYMDADSNVVELGRAALKGGKQ